MYNKFRSKFTAKTVLGAKIVHLCSSVLFLLCGILIIAVSDINDIARYIMVGVASIVIGGAGIFGYFSNDMYRLAFQSDFALGLFNVVFGALLIASPPTLPFLLPSAIGIIAILDGGNKSQIAIEGFRFGMGKWYLVLVSALLELGLGIAVFICAAYNTEIRVWLGVTLSAVGAVNFWTTMYMVRIRDSRKSANTEETN